MSNGAFALAVCLIYRKSKILHRKREIRENQENKLGLKRVKKTTRRKKAE
jgi:hypothetical protein